MIYKIWMRRAQNLLSLVSFAKYLYYIYICVSYIIRHDDDIDLDLNKHHINY